MSHWGIDFGTTNTVLARWDAQAERPRVVALESIRRDRTGDALGDPGLIPTAIDVTPDEDLWTHLGRLPMLANRVLWGRLGWIGRQALERNVATIRPSFAMAFKGYLQHEATRPIARAHGRSLTAREVARTFMRELFAEVVRTSGERIRSIVATVPVDAYETYRAELRGLLEHVGVTKVQFVDEPVAAAMGYGLSLREPRNILVVDFGGGTQHVAMVTLDPRAVEAGSARVVAKAGRPIGGDLVDRWLLEAACQRLGTPVTDDPFWLRLLLDEARRVKEHLLLRPAEAFHLRPPGDHSPIQAKLRGAGGELVFEQADLARMLTEKGVYEGLERATDRVLADARSQGVAEPDDVLMVGGSTLLPGVFPLFERRFGRDRVRAWQPFEAVAYGACALSARDFAPSDFIVHDYAILVHHPDTHERETTVIVPSGTRFPTTTDYWRRQLVPTCALGLPEKMFKLVVCEVGRAHEGERSFGWDSEGRLHRLGDGRLIVPLNEKNPTLGHLDPPHPPGDRAPRLDVRFGIDDDRWLIATVTDLHTGKTVLDQKPVVRLV